jgi:hypothetical protein
VSFTFQIIYRFKLHPRNLAIAIDIDVLEVTPRMDRFELILGDETIIICV